MVMRARTFAALAAAAVPLASAPNAYAAFDAFLYFGGTPTFNCNEAAAGGTINWGNAASTPYLGLGSSSSEVKFGAFGCSNDKFSQALGDADYFQVKFGDFSGGAILDKNTPYQFKFEDKQSPAGAKVHYFDISLNFVYPTDPFTKGIPGFQEFIGIQLASDFKFDSSSVKLTLQDDGSLLFDPANPGSDAVISLYDTPQVTPEPGTLVLLGTGLLGLAGVMRRRLNW